MALPKNHRLRHRKDFSTIYQSGLRRSSPHLTLRAIQSAQASTKSHLADEEEKGSHSLPASKFGISISQKVSKRAVIRNRIKRQIRAVILHLLPLVSPGWRVVIVVRPQAIQCDYEDFLRELKQLLMDAEVINGH